jgi:hypothetical protein
MAENIKESTFNVVASSGTSVDEKISLKERKETSSFENIPAVSTAPERIDWKDLSLDADGEHQPIAQSDNTIVYPSGLKRFLLASVSH